MALIVNSVILIFGASLMTIFAIILKVDLGALAVVSIGAAMIIILLLHGAFLAYREERDHRQSLESLDDVGNTIARLRNITFPIKRRTLDLAEILRLSGPTFANGIRSDSFGGELARRLKGITWSDIPSADILGVLVIESIIDKQRIDPAPGSASSMRPFIYDTPYNQCSLTEFGKRVVRRLSDTTPYVVRAINEQ